MNSSALVLGLLEKRIDGDDCLLELARLRFRQAGLGAELHAGTPEQLEHLLRFRPASDTPVVLHLPREFNLVDELCRNRILDFARQFRGRLRGMVVHDHADMAARPELYLQAAVAMEAALATVEDCPWLFIEYAAGLDPAVFIRFFESIRHLARIGTCIDTGHAGMRQVREHYARNHDGQDVCAFKAQPAGLDSALPEIEEAVDTALPAVLRLVRAIRSLGRLLHFHLHDGHPLSNFSPFGVPDHLSFLSEIPLPFPYRGRRSAPLMFGPSGLKQVLDEAKARSGPAPSFTLEIHPTFERSPLGEAAPLFSHWVDKSNAERMSHWVNVLMENSELVNKLLR